MVAVAVGTGIMATLKRRVLIQGGRALWRWVRRWHNTRVAFDENQKQMRQLEEALEEFRDEHVALRDRVSRIEGGQDAIYRISGNHPTVTSSGDDVSSGHDHNNDSPGPNSD